MNLSSREMARAAGGVLRGDAPPGEVLTDTRALRPGAWFLALRGERFDGHDYLEQAQDAGACGCIVSREPPESWRGAVVRVADTTAALQDLSRRARDRLSCPVIGLTGSSGKTTTRALIALAVSPRGVVHQTVGNLNNHLGVPMTLLAAPDDAAAMVVEMGTSGPGEIEVLARIGAPGVRLIVNVGPAHLQELGGLDGVAREKGALFRLARPGDTCCVNLDDPRVAALELPVGVRRVGWGSAGDVRLLEAVVDPATLSTRARWATPEGEVEATIPAPGRHVAHNAAGALAVAVALGIDPAEAAAAFARYEPVGMRMRPERLSSGALALNDAYNANPQSMEASLRVLASLPGRRAAVLGDMLELGPDEARWHQDVARLAGELGIDLVVLVGPRMAAAAPACPSALAFEEATDAVAPLRAWLGDGDVVLLKGSRGARVERVLHGLTAQEVS